MQPVTGNFTGYRLTGYHFTTLVNCMIQQQAVAFWCYNCYDGLHLCKFGSYR